MQYVQYGTIMLIQIISYLEEKVRTGEVRDGGNYGNKSLTWSTFRDKQQEKFEYGS